MSSNNHVEEIKSRLAIEEVVATYIKIEKAGINFKARCPFHNEKTPSFMVSPERGSFYCFGCGKKGDIFTFVQEFEGIEFKEALKILAEKAGVEIKYDSRDVSSGSNEKDALIKVLNEASVYFNLNLNVDLKEKSSDTGANDSRKVLEYLKSRGLNDESLKKWQIGYALDDWQKMTDYLLAKKYPIETLIKAGLTKKNEKGKTYDYFRSRIMFPIQNSAGQVVAFTGRVLLDDKTQAKYLNSPETPLFNKSKILFGYNFAKGSIRKNNFAILVEGQMDVIMAHQIGYTNTVASSGTAITEDQISLIKRLTNNLVIALDSDPAGIKASQKSWQIAISQGMDIKIAILPTGKDPADLAKDNPESWKNSIKGSVHIIEFLINGIYERKLDARKVAQAIYAEIMPYLKQVKSRTEQSYFIDLMVNKFNIQNNVLWKELEEYNLDSKNIIPNIDIETGSNTGDSSVLNSLDNKENNLELDSSKKLLYIYLWQSQKDKSDLDNLEEIRELLGNEIKDTENISEKHFFDFENKYTNPESLKNEVSKLLVKGKISKLEEKRRNLKRELNNDDLEKLRQIQDISVEIEKLNKSL